MDSLERDEAYRQNRVLMREAAELLQQLGAPNSSRFAVLRTRGPITMGGDHIQLDLELVGETIRIRVPTPLLQSWDGFEFEVRGCIVNEHSAARNMPAWALEFESGEVLALQAWHLTAAPFPHPKAYALVQWRPGFPPQRSLVIADDNWQNVDLTLAGTAMRLLFDAPLRSPRDEEMRAKIQKAVDAVRAAGFPVNRYEIAQELLIDVSTLDTRMQRHKLRRTKDDRIVSK